MATEVEIKFVLADLAAYHAVRTALDTLAKHAGGEAHEEPQVNYYLDTAAGDLHRQRAMARVRVTTESVEFTVKARPTLHNGVISVGEWQAPLAEALADQWRTQPPARTSLAIDAAGWLQPGGVLPEPLAADAALHVLGAMRNGRRKYAIAWPDLGATGGAVLVELDRVHYGAGGAEAERFEVEIETADAHEKLPAVESWLNGLGVAFAAAEETKYAQFLRIRAGSGPLQ